MWISIKGQKVNLDNISAIIDNGKTIAFEKSGSLGAFMILSTERIVGSEDGSGRTPKVSEAEMTIVRNKLTYLGDEWI